MAQSPSRKWRLGPRLNGPARRVDNQVDYSGARADPSPQRFDESSDQQRQLVFAQGQIERLGSRGQPLLGGRLSYGAGDLGIRSRKAEADHGTRGWDPSQGSRTARPRRNGSRRARDVG